MKNASFLPNVFSGKLALNASGVARFGARSVILRDGTAIQDVDAVICCTGYDTRFPFFEDDSLKAFPPNGPRGLFRHCIRADVGASLCFIGWVRPMSGGVPVCGEMAGRYWAALMCGRCALPAGLEKIIERQALYAMTGAEIGTP